MRKRESLALAWLWLLLVALTVCVFCYPVQAQTGNAALDIALQRKSQYSTLLNGSTQYWSKTSPVNMDLNGPELLSNTGFETNIYGWVQGSFTTLTRNTHTDRAHTGSGSLCMTTSSPPSFRYLRDSLLHAVTVGYKYTFEAWVFMPTADSTKSIYLRVQASDFSESVRSSNFTITGNTWTKIVYNVQVSISSFYFSLGWNNPGASDSLYIDDVSLTQAWDGMWIAAINTSFNASGDYNNIVSRFDNAVPYGWILHQTITTNRVSIRFRSTAADQVITNSTSTTNDGKWHIVAATVARDGNQTIYVDGVSQGTGSVAAIGKIVSQASNLEVGKCTNEGAPPFSGSIGQTQMIKFSSLPSDIATTIKYISSTWKSKGFPKQYNGGTIVLDVDWKTPYDKSGNQGLLTGTGSPPYRIPIK